MVAQLCADAIKLRVPMRVDLKFGRNWGDAKHTWNELHNIAEIAPTITVTPPTASPAPILKAPILEAASSAPVSSAPTGPVNGARVWVPESEIRFVSLRDIVNQPLIRNKAVCPFHDDHKPSLSHLPRSLLLLRLRGQW
jgi:hypothetical protein